MPNLIEKYTKKQLFLNSLVQHPREKDISQHCLFCGAKGAQDVFTFSERSEAQCVQRHRAAR